MKNYTLQEIKTKLLENNQTQPKAKYSNNILLAMCEKVKGSCLIQSNPTRSKEMLNRGDIAECLAKLIIIGSETTKRALANEPDLNTTELNPQRVKELGLPTTNNLEIKFSTSYANATPKSNKAKYTLVLNQYGAYLVESSKLNKDSKGHITPNQWSGVRLEKLSKELGY